MKSMTGYAFEEACYDELSLSVEIKGYNSRFLELTAVLPSYLSALEPQVREYMSSRFKRGKIDVLIRVKEQNAGFSVSVNRSVIKAYEEALSTVAEVLGTGEKPSLALILGIEGVLDIERNRDAAGYWQRLERVLKGAADRFDAERSREGKHTQEDILAFITDLEQGVGIIASHGPALEESIRENLRSRFAELLGDRVDENRILTETAILLMKYSISEELSRLSAHLNEFRAEAARNPSPGKKLDFLCQEINREINTIGSKAPILEVSRAVVGMKDGLENIREQLRNVE